jgi:hypothetical protein
MPTLYEKQEDETLKVKPVSRNDIEIKSSPYYTVLTIGEKNYYFIKETGKFDGVSFDIKDAN